MIGFFSAPMSSMSSLVSPGMTYILLPPFPDNSFEMMCSKVGCEREREREAKKRSKGREGEKKKKKEMRSTWIQKWPRGC